MISNQTHLRLFFKYTIVFFVLIIIAAGCGRKCKTSINDGAAIMINRENNTDFEFVIENFYSKAGVCKGSLVIINKSPNNYLLKNATGIYKYIDNEGNIQFDNFFVYNKNYFYYRIKRSPIGRLTLEFSFKRHYSIVNLKDLEFEISLDLLNINEATNSTLEIKHNHFKYFIYKNPNLRIHTPVNTVPMD